MQMTPEDDKPLSLKDVVRGYLVSTAEIRLVGFRPLFETRVFARTRKATGWDGVWEKRYDKRDEAVSGHRQAMVMVADSAWVPQKYEPAPVVTMPPPTERLSPQPNVTRRIRILSNK